MKRMKRVVGIIVASVCMLSVAGCGLKEFDATGYVKSVLDARYLQEYKEYAKMVGIEEKEAKDQLQGEFLEGLKTEITTSQMTATEEEVKQYQDLETEIRSMAKYEVKEAKKDKNDNFTVEVVITPTDVYTKLETIFTEKLQAAVANGATVEQYMGLFLEAEREAIDQKTELEPITYTFNVNYEEKNSQRVYSVPEEQLAEVDSIFVGM